MSDSLAEAAAGREALETLRLMLADEEASDSARVAAAKALLEKFLPKQDGEANRRKKDERAAAVAEAKGILAEFAAAKLEQLSLPPALDQGRPPAATDAGG